MTIPQRHLEVLQALADHPDGLNNGQIINFCRSKVGSELPDEKSVISTILYSLRNSTNYVSKHDQIGGTIHKITAAGKEALEKATGGDGGNSTTEPATTPQRRRTDKEINESDSQDEQDFNYQRRRTDLAEIQDAHGSITLHHDNAIDAPFITIISALRAANNSQQAPRIERKSQKIDALRRLGKLLSDDIHAVLEDIAADLEQLEEA